MATTTAKAFDEFKDKLLLTTTQNQTISAKLDSIKGYLKQGFPSSSDLPLRTTHLIGSASRKTIIRPLDDIDVLAIFNNKDDIFSKYRFDSQAFLYRIRDALKVHSSVRVVGARGQAVRFLYAQPPHVDVAPVFEYDSGGYALPNGRGGWITTDPFKHNDYLATKNQDLGSRLKPLIRMIKRWNALHSKRLKSFHLELTVASTFTSIGGDSRYALEKYFEWGKNHLSVSDPAGYSGDLSSYLTWSQRDAVRQSFDSARSRAALANAAERRGDHAEAIRHWRILLGDEFPGYG